MDVHGKWQEWRETNREAINALANAGSIHARAVIQFELLATLSGMLAEPLPAPPPERTYELVDRLIKQVEQEGND